MKIELFLSDESGDRTIEVAALPAAVGRGDECSVRLDDLQASRRHAEMRLRGGRLFLVDLGSANGLAVNGLRTKECFLSSGDAIEIGQTVIHVGEIVLDPVVARPSRHAREKTAEEGARVRQRWRRRAVVMRLAPVIILLAIAAGLAYWMLSPRPPESAGGPGSATETRSALASRELERLRSLAGRSPRVSSELVAEAVAARQEYADVTFPGGVDPFANLVVSLRSRQAIEASSRLAAVEAEARELFLDRRYGEALERARDDSRRIEAEVPPLGPAAERIRTVVAKAVDAEARRLGDELSFLEEVERFGEAAKLCEDAAASFRGTEHEARLRARASEDVLKAREVLERRRLALENLTAVDAETPVTTVQTKSATKPDAKPRRLASLLPLLAGRLGEGSMAERRFKLEGKEFRPISVEGEETLVIEDAAGTRKVPAAGIPPALQLEIAKFALEGDGLVEAAAFGYRHDLPREAGELLFRYVSESKEARETRQARVDRFLARARGLAAVPQGGFTFTPAQGWETAGERADREALDEAAKVARVIGATTTLESLEKSFARAEAIIGKPGLSPAARGKARDLTIEGLTKARGKLGTRLAARIQKSGFGALRKSSEELKRRRAAALKVIFDTAIYLPESHPDWPKGDKVNGQEAVDKAVAEVRELWDSAAGYTATLDREARKIADMIQAIDGPIFGKLRHNPTGPTGDRSIEEIVNNADRRIDLKTYAPSRADADLYLYNRKVDAYNQALVDPELPEADKAHVAHVNDYREMLGLRRLFIDARLCRATRKHSAACNAAGRIWHDGPDGSPQSRAQAEGFGGGVAENVAIGYSNPKDIWDRGWYRASDHHRNALGAGHTCVGYGYVGQVGTQNFSSIAAPFQ